MKYLSIFLSILAAILLLTNTSIAGWNEDGFKSSPLFEHSLNNTIKKFEGQDKLPENDIIQADGRTIKGMVTQGTDCITTEYTCEGTTCSGETCYSTCGTQNTCYSTCTGETCQSTCASTCSGTTCEHSCDPPRIRGWVYYKDPSPEAVPRVWITDWRLYPTKQKKVMQIHRPFKSTSFSLDGWYDTYTFGKNSCELMATGKLWHFKDFLDPESNKKWFIHNSGTYYKKQQKIGSLLNVNFYCNGKYQDPDN